MTAPEATRNEWQEYADILGRKTTETIDHWVSKREAGIISARELYLIVTALYTTTSGIVPRDVTELLVALDKEITNAARKTV